MQQASDDVDRLGPGDGVDDVGLDPTSSGSSMTMVPAIAIAALATAILLVVILRNVDRSS